MVNKRNFNTNTSNNPTWLTPPELVHALGKFDLDPCCPPVMPWDTATVMLSENGLEADWKGRVWLNPPYGRETFKWLDKLANHGQGIGLVFARTETKGFHSVIWDKAHAVMFFKGRIKFHREDASVGMNCNAPSCLVSYSEQDTLMIEKALADSNNDIVVGRLVNL